MAGANGQPPQQPPGFGAMPVNPQHSPAFEVTMPSGLGQLHLHTVDEVELWNKTSDQYKRDYNLVRVNDLVMLGSILTQNLALFRAQQRINGMEAELDANNVPTGKYVKTKVGTAELTSLHDLVRKSSAEIRELEKSLGIDKKTREAGGTETVRDYVQGLKRAAHQMGLHISRRVQAYEAFVMEFRTKLRMLDNLDDEDKAYEGISPEKVLEWCRSELGRLEEVDKRFAREKGKLFIGKA